MVLAETQRGGVGGLSYKREYDALTCTDRLRCLLSSTRARFRVTTPIQLVASCQTKLPWISTTPLWRRLIKRSWKSWPQPRLSTGRSIHATWRDGAELSIVLPHRQRLTTLQGIDPQLFCWQSDDKRRNAVALRENDARCVFKTCIEHIESHHNQVDTTSNSAPSTPLVPRTNLHNASPSPHTSPTSYIPESGYGGPSSSPTSYIIPSPARSTQTQNGVLIMKDHNVDGPLSVGRESEEDTGGEAMPPQRQASTGSPSLSPDPLLLFTPRRRSVSPRSERAIISPHTFSPITPISSPSKSTQGHVTPPQPSPPHPAPLPSPHMSPHTLHAIQQAQEAERARYSLRTRKAQQLKPYEYDKLLYKRQMRSNPDALVKVVSPPRPTRRQRSKSAQPRDGSDAEDEYLAREDDEDDEEAKEARQRRKGKQREIAGGGEAHGGELDGERATPWIPDVFDESSSSSSDDGEDIVADLNAAKRREEKERRRAEKKRRQEEKERRRKKLKPFPLKKPDLQWSVSSLGEAVSIYLTYMRVYDSLTHKLIV